MKRFIASIAILLSIFILNGCQGGTSGEKTSAQKDGDLLLVIDMQNAYTSQGPWTCPNMGKAADNIQSLIESGSFGEIIFTRFDAPSAPVGTWVNYNEINKDVNENEFLNEIIPQLENYTKRYPIYSKSTYSAATVAEVKDAVEECMQRGDSVVITGVVSECCVLSTAMGIIDMGCPLIYLTDACAGCSSETESAVATVLSGLDYVHTTLLSTDEYLNNIMVP